MTREIVNTCKEDRTKKLKIDKGYPVTLIPQRLFNNVTKMEKMNTNNKNVNDNKIEFVGQKTATVKTH